MRLAEALAERADLDKKLRTVRERARAAARYVEGEEPAESAMDLVDEARQIIARRAELVSRLNATNAITMVHGMSVTAALAKREQLTAEAALLNEIAAEAGPGRDPYTRGRRRMELPEKTDLPVKDLRDEADRLSREARELDSAVQQVNWSTELA